MTTAVASSSLLDPAEPPNVSPASPIHNYSHVPDSPFFVSSGPPSPRGRSHHKAADSTNTFLSSPSPSPSPVSRQPRGPQNPVQFTPARSTDHPLPSPPPIHRPIDPLPARVPQRALPPQRVERAEQHVPRQSSRSRTRQQHQHQNPQQPAPGPSQAMALVSPDMTPLSFSRSPKRKRRSSVQNNFCMPTSSDPGCMAVFLGSKQPRRRRSSSSRGRSQTRVEERNSLLADFQGYEREDSPRTTVSKRMSDLGLLDPAPHHKRDPSSFSNGGSNDVASRAIVEEDEPESVRGISQHHVASQHQALPKIQTSAGSQRRDDNITAYEQDSDRKPSETSDQSLFKRFNSTRTSYSLFPSSSDSPVSPMSPHSNAMYTFAKYPTLRRSNSSPKRQKRSPSPPLAARPVSPARQPPSSNSSSAAVSAHLRKSSAGQPNSARPSAQDLYRRAPSPPLTAGAENPLVWHDSEITGHLMLDPDDDGYGINGVGFKPGKVEEEARRKRRQEQVQEWRKREGEERREERRRRRNCGGDEPQPEPAGDEDRRFVRFAEE